MPQTDQFSVGAGAIEDFRRSRRRAVIEDLMARLTRKSNDLLNYEEVRQRLRAQVQVPRGLQDIPLDRVVGSVGRYTDFTRSFLPRTDRAEARWTRLFTLATDLSGLPPIDVYQIGGSYFVADGNHRVSVARQLKASHIQAYVTEIETRVPFDPTSFPDSLIIQTEYAEFLEHTGLDRLYPGANLAVSVPGQYGLIENHIRAQGVDEALTEQAVRAWYEGVYLAVVAIIRERGMLRDFPNRTETDLYVWTAEHQAALEAELGIQIDSETAAGDLVQQRSPQPDRVAARISERLLDVIRPEAFEAEPPLGSWRQERLAGEDKLFADILVPINGGEAGWWALAQAIGIARREGARLAGLYVVANEAERISQTTNAIQAEFEKRCAASGVQGRLVTSVGSAAQLICDRARWTDLVVVKLSYPPGQQPLERFRSGFRVLVQRCSQPVLAIPGPPTPLDHGLLAYDGSPKAQEALFMAAYLAKQWGMALTVISVDETNSTEATILERARSYLFAQGVEAKYRMEHGDAGEAIVRTAEAQDCDLIITGGYGHAAALEIAFGSTVDHLLRESYLPILICR